MRKAIAVLLIGLLGVFPLMAQDATEADPYSQLVAVLVEMDQLLDQAVYFSSAAVHTPDVHDRGRYIQAVLNLLEGAESPDYDADNEVTVPEDHGLRPLFLEALGLRIELQGGISVLPMLSLPEAYDLVMAWEQVDASLRLAYLSATESMEKLYGRNEDPLRALHAHLVVARGGPESVVPIPGLKRLLELFPPMVIWVSPGESIQDAIDRIPEGGTIHLEPGEYRETIDITKSLTILGGAGARTTAAHLKLYATVSGIGGWRPSILVDAEEGIEVSLRGLRVDGWLRAAGSARIQLSRMRFEGVDSGIEALEAVQIVCEDSQFHGNRRAVSCRDSTVCTLKDTQITGSLTIGVEALGDALLTIDTCTIENTQDDAGDAGHGVGLVENATLHLVNSRLVGNQGYGVFAYAWPCLGPNAAPFEELAYQGEVTGWGNTIPGPDEENGNVLGSICLGSVSPEDHRYLVEPAP
jgi:hypothetical protein